MRRSSDETGYLLTIVLPLFAHEQGRRAFHSSARATVRLLRGSSVSCMRTPAGLRSNDGEQC